MNKTEREFINIVKKFYRQHGRHTLPWKQTKDPYLILVSEIMLQQTQVERVLPKYERFIKKWPTVRRLAAAPLAEVLRAWQGLGYNRRAKMLHDCAKAIANEYKGKWPTEYDSLKQLPGIGPYTAGAVMAFAFNKPVPIIETNIRTAYLHHFFKHRTEVAEAEIMKKVEKTLDTQNPREWYYALMDYGSHLKRTVGNQNQKVSGYKKQSKFKGSDREVRGAIVRALGAGPQTFNKLARLGFEKERLEKQIAKLVQEGMVEQHRTQFSLPS